MNLLDRNFMLTHSQKQYGLPGRENSVRRSVLTCFFLLYFVVRTSLGKQLSPLRGPIASRGGPYQYFQETYPHLEFSGGGGRGVRTPCPHSRSAHEQMSRHIRVYLQETNNQIKRKTFTCHSGCLIYTLRIHGNITKASSVT